MHPLAILTCLRSFIYKKYNKTGTIVISWYKIQQNN